jgi:hypothetical protein
MKVPVQLKEAAILTSDEVDGLPPGQAHWWLRKDSEFVRLPKRMRGDEALELLVHLEPGRYILGVGDARTGVRRNLDVVAPASSEEQASSASAKPASSKLGLKGKSFVLTGDLEAMDREAAQAWLVAKGAKVASSVSGKTDFLVAGANAGPKKLEKAEELGVRVLSEKDLRAELGFPAPKKAQTGAPAAADAKSQVEKLVAGLKIDDTLKKKVEPLVGPKHFADLGLVPGELWGIAIGERGGQYTVHIDLKDRPQWGMRCNCRDWKPCKHTYALLFTAHRHFVPPVPAPEGHRDAARYRPSWE